MQRSFPKTVFDVNDDQEWDDGQYLDWDAWYNSRRKGNTNHGSEYDTDHRDDDYKGFAFLQHDVQCSIQDKVAIPKSWNLFESVQSCYIF